MNAPLPPRSLPRHMQRGPALDDVARPTLSRILHAIRTHLAMEVAFISEFVNGRRHFRYVDEPSPAGPCRLATQTRLESYGARIVDGQPARADG